MRFNSLSEAIRYYAFAPNLLKDVATYSDTAYQVGKIPPNALYLKPEEPNVLIYGKSIWGMGKIIEIDKPEI